MVLTIASDFRARKACGPRGKPVILTRPGLLPQPCSITLLTGLNTESRINWSTRHGSNTQADFVATIRGFIQVGALRRGDILVMDNAAIHNGQRLQQEFADLLNSAGVDLARLPTYSPELNPCEFVFARIKHFIRSPQAVMFDHERGQDVINGNFNSLINVATLMISKESLEETYRHCRTLDLDSHISQVLVSRGYITWYHH